MFSNIIASRLMVNTIKSRHFFSLSLSFFLYIYFSSLHWTLVYGTAGGWKRGGRMEEGERGEGRETGVERGERRDRGGQKSEGEREVEKG